MESEKDKSFRQASVILESAVQFLAEKNNISSSDVWAGIIGKHETICDQLATVLTWGIEEVQNNKV